MELMEKWKKLQNGSDIRGVAVEGVKNEPVNLTELTACLLGKAFLEWLSKKLNTEKSSLSIAIGTDSRISGASLKKSALNSISSGCLKVSDCGIASTPAMFMSCILPELNYDGGIMITASHLPFNRNGMKFFTKEGGLEKKDITEILKIAQSLEEKVKCSCKDDCIGNDNIEKLDLISYYAKDITEKIRKKANSKTNYKKPLSGLKIIVDAGNGAGGFFVEKVLQPLGADTNGSQFLEPDGYFPNHVPNPEDETAMKSIKDAVLKNNADFGIIFDTDVDRAGAVDKFGNEINRNKIIGLMAAIVLEEHPNTTVVTDSITSSELKDFIENKLKGKHLRFKRGYKNVINEAIRLNSIGEESHLAIETSGHGALKENYFLDDGAYLIAKMLVKIAQLKEDNKTIDSLISDLKEPLEAKEFRFNIKTADFQNYGNKILSDLSDFANSNSTWNVATNNYEGIRISFDKNNGNGWFLLRMSLHDPLMPLNIESNDKGGIKTIGKKLYEFLVKYDLLDITNLKSFL